MKRLRLTPMFVLFALVLGAGWFGVHVAHAQTAGLTETFAQQAGFSTNADIRLTIARLIRTVLSFIGVIVTVLILYGGFSYMTAAGDEQRVARAKKIIVNAVIGLVITLASFAIAQFVINSISGATTGTIAGGGPGGGGDFFGDGGSNGQFVLKSFNAECAAALQNFQPQLVFSGNVDQASVNAGGITLTVGGAPIAGSFSVSGSRVSFTPDAKCTAPASQEHCFAPNADVSLTLNPAILKSAGGRPVVCSGAFTCAESFTTGTGVDTKGPTLAMTAPSADASVLGNDIVPLQASANDDTGVSTVEFTAAGASLTPASDLLDSTAKKLSPANFFNSTTTEWNTAGLVTNRSYSISATGLDCAGHESAAVPISVTLRAPTCANGVQDTSLGETGVDCGGTGEFSCGACVGSPCTSNAQCSTGQCTNGQCVSVVRIDAVSPGDGASGNLITILGAGFGATPGSVTFLGTGAGSEVKVTDLTCNGQNGWSDRQIVVRVPANAADGPILVQTASNLADRTDDTFGPHIADFDVNGIARPGLCFMTPADPVTHTPTGAAGSQSTVSGIHLGSPQGSSSVFFGSTQAASYLAWQDASATVIVPPLDAQTHLVQAFVGDNTCSVATTTVCRTDADCGGAGGTCVIKRQGSNQLRFTSTSSATALAAPNLATVDSGWTACKDGTKAGLHCAVDADCSGSTCVEAPNFGPIGQYVTLSGTGFGTSTGTVRFTNGIAGSAQNGQEAVADVNFPAACGDLFWHDGSVTVKVPRAYANGKPMEFGAHKVHVVRAEDGSVSNDLSFNVVNDAPGPSLCLMSPLSGPVGTLVSFEGENFGAANGTALFTPAQSITPAVWGNTEVTDAGITSAVKTGPVQLRSAAGYHTNNIPFQVADCRNNALTCGAGTECCSDGSCRANGQCTSVVQDAFYAWRFSTGPIPQAPHLEYTCNATESSPSPWEGFSKPEDICLNAAVSGSFDEAMDPATLTSQNILVQKCAPSGSDVCAAFGSPIVPTTIRPSEKGFTWEGPAFDADSTYQVTLKGGVAGAIASAPLPDAASALLAQDVSWRFKTSAANTVCTVGAIHTIPPTFTATSLGQKVAYQSQPVSATDKCVVLACTGLTFDWHSTLPDRASLKDAVTTDACSNSATALKETNVGSPAGIVSTVRAGSNPSGTADLNVSFVDPKVVSHSPDCDSACVNAIISATFNTPMNAGTLTGGGVTLKQCANALCLDGLADVPIDVTYVGPNPNDPNDTTAPHVSAVLKPGSAMLPNTHYRATIRGSVTSTSGKTLSSSLPAGTPDFTWIFTTKDSAVSCAIDRVSVEPSLATATFVGQHKEFHARTFGSPDACTKNGQELDPSKFDWAAWSLADEKPPATPSSVGVLSGSPTGALSLASGPAPFCTNACIAAGTSFKQGQAFCGDGFVDRAHGEDCELGAGCYSGNLACQDGTACTKDADCANIGDKACVLRPACTHTGTDAPTCGNGTKDPGEDCDDHNVTNGDGCSSRCLDEGSSSVSTICGDGTIDHNDAKGGESCDDHNAVNGDGCSSNCLAEGSPLKSAALAAGICGDGIIQPNSGETCDDGNATSGDGCSSRCLNEGTGAPICGNGTINAHEDCDDGNAVSGDGCSSDCLLEGSSVSYRLPSFCADGVSGAGELARCEANLPSNSKVGPYAVATALASAAAKVDATTHLAKSTVTGTVGTPAKNGQGTFAVQCACTTDSACGDASHGCGNGSCCFVRPTVTDLFPAQNQRNVCLNTALHVAFTAKMDDKTFGNNLYLELLKTNVNADGTGGTPVTANTCPSGSLSMKETWLARAWDAVKTFFGSDVHAQAAGTRCLTAVTYASVDQPNGSSSVNLNISQPLVPKANYQLVVVGNTGTVDPARAGVLSVDGVGLVFPSGNDSNAFTTGDHLCELSAVDVEDDGNKDSLAANSIVPPSKGVLTKTNEVHQMSATGLADNVNDPNAGQPVAIQPIPNVYSWTWAWNSDPTKADVLTTGDTNPPAPTTTQTTHALVTAHAKNGEVDVFASATVTADSVTPGNVGTSTRGSKREVVLLCENPWPAIDGSSAGAPAFPFVDPNTSPNGGNNATNFSLYYCRDAGNPGTADDLPALLPTPTTGSPVQGLVKETLFTFAGTGVGRVPDAFGVRVIANPTYLPSDLWYATQGFHGSPSPTTLDGYEAVRDGNTVYAVAANQTGDIFPNVYVVSTSDKASAPAVAVFNQIQQFFRLNANSGTVTDVNLCREKGGNYVDADGKPENGVQLQACVWDADCANFKDKNGAAAACDANKAKLRRDTKRLTDLSRMKASFDAFAKTNSHCDVSRAACISTAQCTGNEQCVPDVPELAQGSFIRAMSTSAWPSWTDALGKTLGVTLPTDPINQFFQCPAGADPATCYNATTTAFECTIGSHVYSFESSAGESYTLTVQLEHGGASWALPIQPHACGNDLSKSCAKDADCPTNVRCIDNPRVTFRAVAPTP